MMNIAAFQPLAAWVPIGMSLAALAVVVFHIVAVGTAPQADEGAETHIFQILMAGQTPILLFYAVKWLPRGPRPALLVMGVPLGAAVAAMAPVYFLGW